MSLNLKLAILKRYSTQSDFAFAIKEHESKISQVVRGKRKLTPEQAKIWQEALRCNPKILESVT